jgi:hypothetical protein
MKKPHTKNQGGDEVRKECDDGSQWLKGRATVRQGGKKRYHEHRERGGGEIGPL